MHIYSTLLTLLAMSIAVLACTSPSQPLGAVPTPCPPPACISEPHRAAVPESAVRSSPDPTRDAMTQEMRLQLTDRMTDYIYATATLDLASDNPTAMPNHLADRNSHDRCLAETRQTLYAYTDPSQAERQDPAAFYQQEIDRFSTCLTEGAAEWSQAPITERSVWLRHVLAAAARTNDPSEYHRHLLHNETADPGWVELHQEFRQCQDLAAPVSDRIAVVEDPTAVSAQVRQAIADIADCNSRLTQIRYPEDPNDSTGRSPEPTSPSPNASTPSAHDFANPPEPQP